MNEHQAKVKLLDIAQRIKDEQYRKPCWTNEQNTKNWIIVPTLMALGWDVHSPDVYSEDAGGVTGKVDYGLRIEGKVRVFIEAKALGKNLDDKDAEQTSNYANNKGVAWCVLTNGQVWRVYKSASSAGAALPERLLFEVELSDDNEAITSSWQQLRHLSRESVQNGELDKYANRIFIDNRLRDVLKQLFQEPTQPFLNALQKSIDGFSTKEIRDSLKRLSSPGLVENLGGFSLTSKEAAPLLPEKEDPLQPETTTGTPKKNPPKPTYSLESHLQGKPQQIVYLFNQTRDFITQSALPEKVEMVPKQRTVGFRRLSQDSKVGRYIADIVIQRNKLRLNLVLNPDEVGSLPPNGRDMRNVGKWANGDIEFSISSLQDLDAALPFIKMACQKVSK